MKRVRVLWAVLLLSLLAGCGGATTATPATPTAAPAGVSLAGLLPTPTPVQFAPGEIPRGGAWRRAITRDPVSFNPILAADPASAAVQSLIFPTLLSQDPMTGQFTTDGGMAERWEVAADGRTYTFYLRPNVTWSDGDPVDAADFKFTYEAIAQPTVDSAFKRNLEALAAIEVVDPLTLRVTFKEVQCDGLADLQVGWLPSHFFLADPEFEFGDLVDNPFNDRPQLSAGPFILQSWTPGDGVVLTRNQRFWRGAPYMDRHIFRIVADPAERAAMLLSGELDEAPLEPEQLPLIAQNPTVKVARFSEDGYDFLALNLADPENPQPGLNANGSVQVQTPHPILGDPAVRAAIAHALDDQAILDTVYLKQAYPLAVNVPPVIPWAHDPGLQPYFYDPNLARGTLEDAGWIDTNRDGIREKDIDSLSLTLLTRAGGRYSEQLAVLIEDQLEAVGFDITVTPASGVNFAETLLGQRYDMAITGWSGLGADPDDRELWSAAHDRPGEGFNFVSYYSPEVEALLQQGLEMPGCQLPDRAPIYKEVQRRIHEDLPYIFLAGAVRNVGYDGIWGNVRPGPWNFYHNVHEWYTTTP